MFCRLSGTATVPPASRSRLRDAGLMNSPKMRNLVLPVCVTPLELAVAVNVNVPPSVAVGWNVVL
jgi:hypothetical protein